MNAGPAARPEWHVRVPASSANLGAGFDVLGMALTLYADAGIGTPPEGARRVDRHHPAWVAFESAGGTGPLWFGSTIPAGRGLGFSGAARVAGAAAAIGERCGSEAIEVDDHRAEILAVAARLERHPDNAAASLHGGIVVAVDTDPVLVVDVPIAMPAAIVTWTPNELTTATDQSRRSLPAHVERRDAVHNLARVATFVAAVGSGRTDLLRIATDDRLHQPQRLDAVPSARATIDTALELGAWAAWLSGSGPTVAIMCSPSDATRVASGLAPSGHTKQLAIDPDGLRVIRDREPPLA